MKRARLRLLYDDPSQTTIPYPTWLSNSAWYAVKMSSFVLTALALLITKTALPTQLATKVVTCVAASTSSLSSITSPRRRNAVKSWSIPSDCMLLWVACTWDKVTANMATLQSQCVRSSGRRSSLNTTDLLSSNSIYATVFTIFLRMEVSYLSQLSI